VSCPTELLFTFRSSHDALKFARDSHNAGYKHEIVPTPRAVASECGFAILIHESENESIYEFAKTKDFRFEKIYRVFFDKGAKIYECCN